MKWPECECYAGKRECYGYSSLLVCRGVFKDTCCNNWEKGTKILNGGPDGGGAGELEEYTITMFTYQDCTEEFQAGRPHLLL